MRNVFALWFWVLVSEGLRVFYIQNIIDVVGKSLRRKIISKLYVSRRNDFICDKTGENLKTKHRFPKIFDFLAS
jgi:hypothetical protein